ncbi:MAG: hypothetical protein KDD48_08985 [Bdellovibrionales bacterium]|nr:hypothetical protein [Bdellovibrionales bacterium]
MKKSTPVSMLLALSLVFSSTGCAHKQVIPKDQIVAENTILMPMKERSFTIKTSEKTSSRLKRLTIDTKTISGVDSYGREYLFPRQNVQAITVSDFNKSQTILSILGAAVGAFVIVLGVATYYALENYSE